MHNRRSWLASEIKNVGADVVGFFELAVDRNIFFHSAKSNLNTNQELQFIQDQEHPED